MVEKNFPQHIAIIPDGNRRWSAKHNLPALEGHKAGAEKMHQVVDKLIQYGLKYLTLWGFSTDNWKRDAVEVAKIFQVLRLWIEKDTPWFHEKGVRLKHIGNLSELPLKLQKAITQAIDLTSGNQGMTLNLAFNYSGRAEIVDAIRKIIIEGIPERLVDEKTVGSHLYTDGIPDVDLVIRTADEYRISNFMLWQVAYAEFYFANVFWPDFDMLWLETALQAFSQRHRRFGGD